MFFLVNLKEALINLRINIIWILFTTVYKIFQVKKKLSYRHNDCSCDIIINSSILVNDL